MVRACQSWSAGLPSSCFQPAITRSSLRMMRCAPSATRLGSRKPPVPRSATPVILALSSGRTRFQSAPSAPSALGNSRRWALALASQSLVPGLPTRVMSASPPFSGLGLLKMGSAAPAVQEPSSRRVTLKSWRRSPDDPASKIACTISCGGVALAGGRGGGGGATASRRAGAAGSGHLTGASAPEHAAIAPSANEINAVDRSLRMLLVVQHPRPGRVPLVGPSPLAAPGNPPRWLPFRRPLRSPRWSPHAVGPPPSRCASR